MFTRINDRDWNTDLSYDEIVEHSYLIKYAHQNQLFEIIVSVPLFIGERF